MSMDDEESQMQGQALAQQQYTSNSNYQSKISAYQSNQSNLSQGVSQKNYHFAVENLDSGGENSDAGK